jgi:hypothetical protein
MERFLARHQSRILGTLSGFDRMLFRGSLRSISYVKGLEIFLLCQHVLHKDFGKFVEKCSKRIIEHAKSMAERKGRPYIFIQSSKESKEDTARKIAERDKIKEGLIAIFRCVEPCQSFDIHKNRESKWLDLVSKERKCLHLYFYYMDREFGLMHVRLQTWIPFTIQVCINGREWLSRQMTQAGIEYTKRENCFTFISDFEKAQQIMDRLSERKWQRMLNAFARAVNPWIARKERWNIRGYYWSVRQGEYATDVVFKDSQQLADLYQSLVKHAIFRFSSEDVMRFLQRRTDRRFSGEASTNMQRIEGIRVKHWVEENSIKMYDKQGSVLRIETTINNPRRFKVYRRRSSGGKGWLPMRKGIADMRRRVELSRSANARYLDALSVVELETPSHRLMDGVSKRVQDRGRWYRPLRPISPEDAELFKVIMQGQYSLQGIRNQDLQKSLILNSSVKNYSAQIGRRLALLRAHGLIYKVEGTHYYRITKKGHELMSTAIKFRQTDIALLKAA